MRKDVVIQDGAIIALEPANSGLTRLLTYIVHDGKRSLVEVVDLTPDECAKLGGALYLIAITDKHRKAKDGEILFHDLAIGQKFRFVDQWAGKVCEKIDGEWINYRVIQNGREGITHENARVIPIGE